MENIYHYNKIRDDQVIFEKEQDKMLDNCMRVIMADVRSSKKMTTFRIPLENKKAKLWDCKLVSYYIMTQLRSDDFTVKYMSPNILFILHPQYYHKQLTEDKIKIYKLLAMENINTIKYFNK